MLSKETLETYRRMTPGERLELALRMTQESIPALFGLAVPYAIMGGWAVRIYALPRPTYDVDFTIAIDRERLPELYAAAEAEGFTLPEQYRSGWVDSVADMPLIKFRMYLESRGIDIDIFLAESEYQRELMTRRVQHQVGGEPAWFVTAEDLILLKLIAGRARDRRPHQRRLRRQLPGPGRPARDAEQLRQQCHRRQHR